MTQKIDIRDLEAAVETLWFGLAEETRSCFSAARVEESAHPEPSRLVSARAVSKDLPLLVVHHGSIERDLASRPDLAWRSELAKQMRREARRCQELGPDALSDPAPPRQDTEQRASASDDAEPRMTFERFSAAIDGWSAGDLARETDPGPTRSTRASTIEPPLRASSPDWASVRDTSESAEPVAPTRPPFAARMNPIRWLLAPARFAFRRRHVSGGWKLALWTWRVVVVAAYVTTVGGALYLAFAAALRLGAEVEVVGDPDGGPDDRDPSERREAVEVVEVAGTPWIVPAGWSVESDGLTVRWEGPGEASIEIRRLEEIPAGEIERARLCAGGRRAFASLGGAGLEYVEIRELRSTGWWLSRCVFDDGAMVRATAPRLTFQQEHLGEWLLLATLHRHLTSAGETDG